LVQLIVMFISFIVTLILLVQYFNYEDPNFLVGAIIFAGVCTFFGLSPLYVFTVRMFVSLPQRRIKRK
jgi:hypothetical protein